MPRRRIISSSSIPLPEVLDETPQIIYNSKRSSKLAGTLLLILLVVSVALSVFGVYKYWSAVKKIDEIGKNLKQSAQSTKNSKILIDKINRLILLPKNEPPSIATINNVVQLQKQSSFYKDARNGDVLLIYFQAKKAFIYDPEQNIIVNTGPVFMEKNLTDVPAVASISTSSVSSTTSTP